MNVDGYGDAIPVPAFGPRMVCTACGIVGAFARPNWQGARARAGRGEPDGGTASDVRARDDRKGCQ
jgi:hypothetical protein